MEGLPENRFPDGAYDVEMDLPDHLPLLERGSHPPRSGRACAMEAASWLAGEKWSDHPRTVQRAIASVGRWVNDTVGEDERQRLWPWILASLDTASGGYRVDRRLSRLSREAGCRAAKNGKPVEAWTELLCEHARLTGHKPSAVPKERLESLYAFLRGASAKRPGAGRGT